MQNDHWKIDKYNHTKEHKDLSWENLMEKKTQQNFLCIRCIKSTRKYLRQIFLLLASIYIYISPMRYTQVSVCLNEEHNSSIYALSVNWILT